MLFRNRSILKNFLSDPWNTIPLPGFPILSFRWHLSSYDYLNPPPTNTACEHNLLTFVNISYVYVEILLWSIVTLWLFKGNLVGCVTIWKRLQKSDLRLKSLFLFLYEQLLLSQLIFQLPRIKISKSGIPGDDPNPFQTEILPYCLESSKKVFFLCKCKWQMFLCN